LGGRAARRDRLLKVRLLSVGKDKGPTAELVKDYAARIQHFAELDLLELKASGMEAEADALLDKAKQKGAGELWVLDQRGGLITSDQLAQRIGRLRDASFSLTLLLGGDEGLSPRVREQARFVWSLSPLTLPHRLARVVALEQVYRAFEILRGGPYHK
jgi:23S rRNA (pseudouridine1915-N3)-methyltransferase